MLFNKKGVQKENKNERKTLKLKSNYFLCRCRRSLNIKFNITKIEIFIYEFLHLLMP